MQYEPHLFDCENCEVAKAMRDLQPENVQAWGLFHKMANRFVVDTHSGGAVFRRLTEDLTSEEVEEAVERVAVIYDVLYPPKTE